ncbi:MAG: M61 family peptidase [Bacteroidia bacterium]|nr:M61 family peptidase [Bacteroidia bacterium]MCF8426770.1 M61 family peptidase [Bacteroidia bacterium]MCF8445562.1 M61 family peptidase [Bacteroidia bacterium]
MYYKISISNPEDHFVKIIGTIAVVPNEPLQLQLPAWRPGRYELANYAKNIRNFVVEDISGKSIPFKKISKDCWEIESVDSSKIRFSYEYYANQPDAGASYVKDDLLYINPVNCFMYQVGKENSSFEIELDVPDNWDIACQLVQKEKTLFAPNFDTLADSPFFVGPDLKHYSFEEEGANVHFWFAGGDCNDPQKLILDTRAYLKLQVKIFRELPLKDFHFLYLLLPDKFRHGVEHCDSTVIAMGPASEFSNPDFYNDFLAISSHELFHLWNVKRIRPVEMLPYNFTKENYSQLGYVYEGVTTYYGDLILYRSGVWDFAQYVKSLESDFDKHFNNEGRFNYSVAESSYDTWLDGYVPGVKGRKVSIYMEGLIAAWVADILILEKTHGAARFDQVMRMLYEKSYLQNKGYTKEMYLGILEKVSGLSFSQYFEDLIDGKGKWDNYIYKCLNTIGLNMVITKDESGVNRCKIYKIENPTNEQLEFFEIWSKSL